MLKHRAFHADTSGEEAVLRVYDYPFLRWYGPLAVEKLLAMIGHPCCYVGIGRIPGVGYLAHRLLRACVNWTSKGERLVAEIVLTREQAVAIEPSIADWFDNDD